MALKAGQLRGICRLELYSNQEVKTCLTGKYLVENSENSNNSWQVWQVKQQTNCK